MRKQAPSGTKPKSSLRYSSYYFGHWKCTQDPESGDIVDSSGNNHNLVLGAQLADGTEAGIWADNSGYLSMPGKEDNDADGLQFSASAVVGEYPDLDWNDTGLIILATFNQSAAEQTSGFNDILGTGGSNAAPGWKFSISGSGGLQFRVNGGGSEVFNTLVGNIDDGADHAVVVGYDGPTETLSLWVDETPILIASGQLSGASALLNNANQNKFSFGTTSNAAQAFAASLLYRDVHMLHVPNGIPANINKIIKYYSANKFAPIHTGLLGA